MCQAHPKGGEICWHPTHNQLAKQCWLPKDLRVVLQDFEFCPKSAAPTKPETGVCKGQEGIPTLEDVKKNHNGCPLHMICPSMLPPLDFTRCMVKYACGTGGPLLKPVHGGPHGSTHGGEVTAAGDWELSDVDGHANEDADLAGGGAAGAEQMGRRRIRIRTKLTNSRLLMPRMLQRKKQIWSSIISEAGRYVTDNSD
jgi:hypothetical protein